MALEMAEIIACGGKSIAGAFEKPVLTCRVTGTHMSKTLFWYLLKDLLRIFAMTAGTLAGIMSFGALLRPLTQHGLDLGQVGQILSYFSPAMTTYSLPIAALFATTIVYGRVSADNELTACRAS